VQQEVEELERDFEGATATARAAAQPA
jgi:hypothetical protein